MSDDRIDFSSLELKPNSARFEQMVHAVVEGASSAPKRSFLVEWVRVGRVAVVSASLVAFAAWIPSLTASISEPSARETAVEDPIALFSEWAQLGHVPANADPFQALHGGQHGQ